MSDKQKILLSDYCRGRKLTGVANGTIKPGMRVQIDVSEGINANGLFTFEPFDPVGTGTIGNRGGAMMIVLEDAIQGRTISDAYADDELLQVYCPVVGDELLVLLDDGSDAVAFGDMLISRGDGTFTETTGSVESEPFQALETVGSIDADTLVHAMYTGN
jgi:hypothetical protein